MMRRRDFIAVLSGAVALPVTAGAQQPGRSYRIAYLALFPDEDTTLAQPFLQRLHELGYDEGKNITLAYRSADGRPERLPQLAAELVQARACYGLSQSSVAARQRTPMKLEAVFS